MELVSGPDVGGGFLFQLTRERAEPLAAFTVHAQEGGLDGGARLQGLPDQVGFERVAGMCSIGGRHCYHRVYELPLEETTRVRFAYNRMRFVIGPMLEQLAGQRPIPFAAGVNELLPRISARLAEAAEPWMVGGSASAALQGAAIRPRDVDVLTTERGVDLVGEALSEYLIEPPSRTQWGPGPPRRAARAFVGTLVEGLRVEWASARADDASLAPDAQEWTAGSLAHSVRLERTGLTVPVAPMEFALAAALRRPAPERVDAIVTHLLTGGLDRTLLDRLLDGDARARVLLGDRLAAAPETPVASRGSPPSLAS